MFKLYITPLETFHTKYGKVKINRDGYYEISSKKENNKGKMWHRLIWEEYYGKLPKNTHIHHIDMNRKNNCILNLEPMVDSEHIRLHRIGKNRSEKELLEKCRSCENYSELMEVVYSNMIISVGGFTDE